MESFIGFVYPNGFNFAPRDFSFCAGQIIPISSNQAVFALLGANFGGDGRSSMGLPDLRGRAPVGSSVMGSPLPPLQPVRWGERGGLQYTTLSQAQMPVHNHGAVFTPSSAGSVDVSLEVSTEAGNASATDGFYFANGKAGIASVTGFVDAQSAGTTVEVGGLSASGGGGTGVVTVENSGASSLVDIQNPYTGMSYVIAIEGVFPSRN